ncbi:hypothetical protein [Arthrobacter sp. Ld5]|uniref:hypothetical protein n=1 Tax=Arthrobacter sp. Ld5 TaxID=649152 RepID=UPI003EBA2F57
MAGDSVAGVRTWEVALRWGIVLGAAAVAILLLSPLIIANVGTMTVEGESAGSTLVTVLVSIVPSVLLPFSAALVGAALVMRHAEALASAAPRPAARDHAD